MKINVVIDVPGYVFKQYYDCNLFHERLTSTQPLNVKCYKCEECLKVKEGETVEVNNEKSLLH